MKKGKNRDIFTAVRAGVAEVLGEDDSGHGMGHIDRVAGLTEAFAGYYKGEVNTNAAMLAAYLHEVDDYKIVGRENAAELVNATRIMKAVGIDQSAQTAVKGIIETMGYTKSLRGIRPTSLEGMIVSDADMCDAIGVSGVVRCLTYALSSKGSGIVFDRTVWPDVELGADRYNEHGTTHDGDSFINHFFEKLLKVKGLMMTEPGKQEAAVRDAIMVDILRHYFKEQNAPNWSAFLEEYLRNRQ